MKFCSVCGAPVSLEIPEMDNRLRHVCSKCRTIHYQNPRIVAGTLPFYEDKILLCKRAIEPRLGFWTLPAGFMENEETTPNAAVRETLEEANARVNLGQLISIIDVPHISQVHMFFAAELSDLNYSSGPESLEVELFTESDIPWEEIAFPTVYRTLKHFLKARANNIATQDIQLLVDHIKFKDRVKE